MMRVLLTSQEKKASLCLTALFALRMLGLFIILPVFAIEAARYPHAQQAASVGMAMGVYGLVQAIFQIPLGWASDRWGRKPVVVIGMLIFSLGSLVAMQAQTLEGLLIGRALQGAGAVSAAVTAWLADLTRPQVRTQAMAGVGMSIAAMFVLSLLIAPLLVDIIHLSGLFAFTALLALGGVLWVWHLPSAPLNKTSAFTFSQLLLICKHPALQRLNIGAFVLHAVQVAMWMVLPSMLIASGWSLSQHWQLYFPSVLMAILIVGGVLFRLERQGHTLKVLRASIVLLIGVQVLALYWLWQHIPLNTLMALILLTLFFIGFNALEATQPSLTSTMAPSSARGLALGLFNTSQSLGFFAGGALGGLLLYWQGGIAVFIASALVLFAWLISIWNLPISHSPHSD